MERSWWYKVIGIFLLTVLAVIYLLPSLYGNDLPDWYTDTIERRLALGLDIQGGIHMVLGVEVEKAVADYVDRMTEEVSRYAEDEKLPVQKVTAVEGEPVLVVLFADADSLTQSRGKLTDYLGNMSAESVPEGFGEHALAFRLKDDFSADRKRSAVSQAIETIRNRIDEMAVREAMVAKQGESAIVIQIPGVEDVDRARRMIGQTAQLFFKIVDDEFTGLSAIKDPLPEGWELRYENVKAKSGGLARTAYLEGVKDPAGKNLIAIRDWLKGKVDTDHEILFEEFEETKVMQSRWRSYALLKRAAMSGDTITDARVSVDERQNRPYVSINFDRQGANQFGKLTSDHVKERMAIVLDNEVRSAPVIQSAITGGRAMITLNALKSYNELFKEAQDLSVVLRAGALPAPVRFEAVSVVGPTLGADSIEKGKMAALVGTVLVVLFMVFYYRFSGLFANAALVLNVLFIMAVLAAFEGTLTMPGIAGIVLTIGMAVDANVLINERIREELRIGKTPKAAVETGYGKAFWTIFDSNLTTALSGFVMWSYGTGPVKGFAVTLLLGIASSMFTAIVVTRLIFDYVTSKKRDAETISI